MPRKKSSPQLTLFPFLSVLACTIGTLILLVVVVTVSSLGGNRPVIIVAGSGDQGKDPSYIDCSEAGALLLPQETLIPVSEIDSSSIMGEYLDPIARQRSQRYVLVVVRPSGFECFQSVRLQVEDRDIDIGFEPADPEWELRI